MNGRLTAHGPKGGARAPQALAGKFSGEPACTRGCSAQGSTMEMARPQRTCDHTLPLYKLPSQIPFISCFELVSPPPSLPLFVSPPSPHLPRFFPDNIYVYIVPKQPPREILRKQITGKLTCTRQRRQSQSLHEPHQLFPTPQALNACFELPSGSIPSITICVPLTRRPRRTLHYRP